MNERRTAIQEACPGPAVAAAALACVLAAGCAIGDTREAPPPEIRDLVLAERTFARTSVETGMREAFLAVLADDAVIFRPGPVPGKEWFSSRPAVEGRLSWEPLWVDASRAGDLGYTSGPWQYSPGDGDPTYGWFVSVWRRQVDGAWKVEADIGVSCPRPEGEHGNLGYPTRARRNANRVLDAGEVPDVLATFEAALAAHATRLREQGAAAACRAAASEHLRLYRAGAPPVLGREKACRSLDASGEHADLRRAGMGMSESGDLAYDYGLLDTIAAGDEPTSRSSSYLDIWKIDGEGAWRLVLDLRTQPPPAQGGGSD
jgi:ketosteroid isomerase-like protein